MSRFARVLGLCLLAGGAQAADTVAPKAMLQIDDPGCVEGAPAAGTVRWEKDDRALYRQTMMFSSRERVVPGPVEVDVTDRWVAVWIGATIAEPEAGDQAATCVRPVTLTVLVEPLPQADYTWVLRRSSRASDEPAYRRALQALRAKTAAEAGQPQAPADSGKLNPNNP